MENKDIEEIKKEIDIKLASEIAKSVVHEMSKMENAKSNVKLFTFISILMCVISLICIIFTSFVSIKLIDFMNSMEIVIETETTEDVAFDAQSDTGDANNIYNSNSSGSTITTGGN